MKRIGPRENRAEKKKKGAPSLLDAFAAKLWSLRLIKAWLIKVSQKLRPNYKTHESIMKPHGEYFQGLKVDV